MVGLQLKSTYSPDFVENGSFVVHDLEGERYNRMLEPGTVPRFMVVIVVPPPDAALIQLEEEAATLRAVGWWGRVEGEPTDQEYKRVRIPTTQRFDADGLLEMLASA
jgi:hypothetical protein